MKNLKTYSMFESVTELTQEQVEWLDKCTKGTWTLNPQTGLVDVDLDFSCTGQDLTDFKGVKFGVVGGHFSCYRNLLTSLVGAPQSVGGGFRCNNNRLTSLEGAPLKVGWDLSCENNPVSRDTLKKIFAKMQKGTSYLAAVESLWSKIPQDDQVLLYADDFKWVTPEQSRGLVALRAYQELRGML